eukprot:gnl/TRDRNA2_/TRDRNA2_177151_c6_seq1.p1 gnl/TRDRNA2_/TRDRNA2_177151_c6~~gnl/TRDRNA2_/TRDRNA2_177151_c6_seq1.p1  ORF type:complete len:443 (+),score=69.42 gnl/TRDRNA2_/TRDRNA2_177151_c6_seq1:119-1447(+)
MAPPPQSRLSKAQEAWFAAKQASGKQADNLQEASRRRPSFSDDAQAPSQPPYSRQLLLQALKTCDPAPRPRLSSEAASAAASAFKAPRWSAPTPGQTPAGTPALGPLYTPSGTPAMLPSPPPLMLTEKLVERPSRKRAPRWSSYDTPASTPTYAPESTPEASPIMGSAMAPYSLEPSPSLECSTPSSSEATGNRSRTLTDENKFMQPLAQHAEQSPEGGRGLRVEAPEFVPGAAMSDYTSVPVLPLPAVAASPRWAAAAFATSAAMSCENDPRPPSQVPGTIEWCLRQMGAMPDVPFVVLDMENCPVIMRQGNYKVRMQIEKYFAMATIAGNTKLRSLMDAEGWVALQDIVYGDRTLGVDVAGAADALRFSENLEVSGDGHSVRIRCSAVRKAFPRICAESSPAAMGGDELSDELALPEVLSPDDATPKAASSDTEMSDISV